MKQTERFRPVHPKKWRKAVELANDAMREDTAALTVGWPAERFRACVENQYRRQGGSWVPNDTGWTWEAAL